MSNLWGLHGSRLDCSSICRVASDSCRLLRLRGWLQSKGCTSWVRKHWWRHDAGLCAKFGHPQRRVSSMACILENLFEWSSLFVLNLQSLGLNLAWSKLILNDYPVYGLAVYGLARGPGHRFHIKYLKLKVLGPSFFQTAFTFRPQQIQTPGKQKSSRKCLKGVCRWTCQSKPLLSRNQAESV